MKGFVLLIDTSSMTGLCAIADNSHKVLAQKYVNAKSSHSEMMFIAIEDVLKSSNVNIGDIKEIVYTAGPGSFTGLRIAYSAVKGFSLALDIGTHGISSLKALLYNIKDTDTYKCSLIQGNKDEVYALVVGPKGEIVTKENCYRTDELFNILKGLKAKVTCVGSGAVFYRSQLSMIENVLIPENEAAHIITPAGMLSLLDKENIDGINYLKASYAEIKKEKR